MEINCLLVGTGSLSSGSSIVCISHSETSMNLNTRATYPPYFCCGVFSPESDITSSSGHSFPSASPRRNELELPAGLPCYSPSNSETRMVGKPGASWAFSFDTPTVFLRTNARLRPQRGHRRTISCKSGSALLRDNYMAHRWVRHLGTGVRGLGPPIHPILQASAYREGALTNTSRAGKGAKQARLFVLPGS